MRSNQIYQAPVDFVFGDDALQEALYPQIEKVLSDGSDSLVREISNINTWFKAGGVYYHNDKMLRSSEYTMPDMPGRPTFNNTTAA